MCGLYTREINLNPYFLYSQHVELKVSFLFVTVASASASAVAGPPPDCRRTSVGLLPDLRRTRPRKQGKGRPKCDHCGKLGHKIDKCYALHECEHCGKPSHKIDRCYALHGRPPRSDAAVLTNLSPPSSTGDPPSVSPDTLAIFNKFLKWYKDHESSSSTASIAHIGTSFVGLTRSSSLGPWVFDSGATDHITGNKSLFSSLSSPNHLPSVTLADGSRVSSHGVGTVKLFPSLTIDNVLYVPRSPFNLLSISRLTRCWLQVGVCYQSWT